MTRRKGKTQTPPPPPLDREDGKRCLLEISTVLDKQNLPYFLIQGTALGAYRDQGFTPTERDIDFGFLYEQFQHVAGSLLWEFSKRGFEIETVVRPFTKTRTIVVFKYGWRADLVSWYKWKDKRFETAPINPRRLCGDYSIVHPAEMIENTETVELFGKQFQVPSPIEKYLEREYGEDWKTPREDHESRTRIYDFVKNEGIPHDHLEPKSK